LNEIDRDAKVAKLIASLTNTMSDQGSVNPVFNSALADLRSDLLPVVIDNWLDLSEESQTNLRPMGNFFCKMHLLVNFATECDKALKEFEQNITVSGRNPHSFSKSESGACRLVRTAAKALTTHGSEKAGVASY
jgi:E1A/CREB-binding protein